MITVFIKSVKVLFLASTFFSPVFTFSQQNVIDKYLDSAFSNNIVLQQKSIILEKARLSLEIAKGMYYPSVAFQAGYQTAGGGRDISFPLGDLLNNVYSTLNQLTASNNFPQLENQNINFLPKNFYDSKVRTTMPILNPDLRYGKSIAQQQISLSEYEVQIYKRELVKNIKTAYFNYLSALQAINIYQQAAVLANEGKRVNQKLLDNGKGLPAYVLRASSEVESINAQITAAEQQAENARLYFNFLLNREQTAAIDTAFNADSAITTVEDLLAKEASAANREELKSLQLLQGINETVVEMNKRFSSPRLNGFLDLGSQAENFKFNAQSRYYLLGLQLEVPIFSGYRNKNKIKQTELDLKNSKLSTVQATQQLNLSGNVARNNVKASWQTFNATVKQLEAAASYQRLIERGYREGTNSFIETVDARNQYTQAQLLYTINQYKVLIAAANLERETATYQLKK
jgi:outer membrane protein